MDDYSRKEPDCGIRKVYIRTGQKSGEIDENIPDDNDKESEAAEERIELLKRSFALAISSRKRVYIMLTWIAGALFMLDLDVSKIKSIDTLDKTFAKKTLFEMRDMIVAAAGRIPWLELTREQHDMMSEALNEYSDDGRVFGEITYSEFYMKKGDKATISLESPPAAKDDPGLPWAVVMGPSITMAFGSVFSSVYTVQNIMRSNGDISSAIPTMVMAVCMVRRAVLSSRAVSSDQY